MILFWTIRYLDRTDREFKDRHLFVDTNTLDPNSKAAVELCYELNESGTCREILKFRHLFLDDEMSIDAKVSLCGIQGFGCVYFLQEYFEDECGKELCGQEIAQIITGSRNVLAIPPWAQQHDVDYMLAPRAPIQIDKITASDEDLKTLGYFVRDLRELENSAFRKDGPGRLSWTTGKEPSLQTAVSDGEIRSFVTIFRRLYMEKEPANFLAAVMVFEQLAGDYPLVRWVAGVAKQHEANLRMTPNSFPCAGSASWSFTRKRLIDVFIYTQYAHQPNERRIRQFHECMTSVGNQKQLLTGLFLTELWSASLEIINAGRVIARVYEAYCSKWGRWPQLLDSVANDNPGLGRLETKENRRHRIVKAKVESLAEQLWHENGQPAPGPVVFIARAEAQLQDTLVQ